jgi:hypothetical protein
MDLDFLGADFEAIGLCVMSLEGTQRVERQKRGAIAGSPFLKSEDSSVGSKCALIGIKVSSHD